MGDVRQITVELMDGSEINVNTSAAALMRVEEAFGCPYSEAIEQISGSLANGVKFWAALAGRDEKDLAEVLDVPAIMELNNKFTALFPDADDDEGGKPKGNAGAGSGSRAGKVPGNHKPRPKKKTQTRRKA